jgi:hypothetical protein
MKNLVRVLHVAVFALAASVIISIFYEGMVLRWFSFVPLLMMAMDCAFILATICNLVYFRKRKGLLALNLFSFTMIVAMIVITLVRTVFGFDFPDILMVFWSFYIFFYYYTMVIKQTWKYPVQNISDGG